MGTVGSEGWTATSTTTWPAQWSATSTANSGTVSVANTRGRMTPSGTGYKTVRRMLTGIGASSAVRVISGTIILSAVTESYPKISGREATGGTDYPNGYYLQLNASAGTWQLLAGYGTGQYGNATPVTQAMAAGNTLGYEIRVEGFTISASMWNVTTGQSKPAAYQSSWTDTDSAVASGVPALSMQSGNTTNPYVEFGPVTVTDGAGAAVTTGFVKRYESGAWVRRRVLVFDGSTWTARPVKFRASDGTWRRSNS